MAFRRARSRVLGQAPVHLGVSPRCPCRSHSNLVSLVPPGPPRWHLVTGLGRGYYRNSISVEERQGDALNPIDIHDCRSRTRVTRSRLTVTLNGIAFPSKNRFSSLRTEPTMSEEIRASRFPQTDSLR